MQVYYITMDIVSGYGSVRQCHVLFQAGIERLAAFQQAHAQ